MDRNLLKIYRMAMVMIVLCASGCASDIAQFSSAPSSYAQTPAAQATLEESLFKEDTAVMSNQDMMRILAEQIRLPDNARLAVVRFGQLPYWWGWSEDFVRVNDKIDSDFLGALGKAKRISRVSYLPSLVTPKEMTLPYLRQAAARFQADLLLVYRTSSKTYERNKLFSPDETKAYCTVEAILLDTRTGIVPFSTVVTENFTAKKTKEDYDFNETIAKASQQAIGRAWLHLADDVKKYLDGIQ